MPTDPKWRVIARKSGQPLACVIAVFNMMMVAASQNTVERGTLEAWDDEDVGAALDMEADAIRSIRDAMQGKVLDGFRLAGWERRQPKREDNSAERVKAYRERQRTKADAVEREETPDPKPVTQCNAPETETETDKITPNGVCASSDAPAVKPEHIVEEWNRTAPRLSKPKVRDLTDSRRQLLKARATQYTLDDFLDVFGKIERSPFLRGDTGWHGCTFDWVFKRANFQKILEGNYDQ
jgi:hypothetical protein